MKIKIKGIKYKVKTIDERLKDLEDDVDKLNENKILFFAAMLFFLYKIYEQRQIFGYGFIIGTLIYCYYNIKRIIKSF